MPMFLRHRCTSPPLFVHSPRFPPPCPCPYPTGAVTTTVMITTTTTVLRVESHAWKGFAPLASYSLNGPILSPRLDFTTTVSCKRTFPLPSRTPPHPSCRDGTGRSLYTLASSSREFRSQSLSGCSRKRRRQVSFVFASSDWNCRYTAPFFRPTPTILRYSLLPLTMLCLSIHLSLIGG